MLPHAWKASWHVVVEFVWWCCGLVYMTTCKWWQGSMACQALYLCFELPDLLPINVVPSVAQCLRCNSGLNVAYYLKAFALLGDSFLVNAPCGVLAGPRNFPCVPRVPHGSCIAIVDHVGMLMAFDVEHYTGLGPSAPFANVPSEHHLLALHALPRSKRAKASVRHQHRRGMLPGWSC